MTTDSKSDNAGLLKRCARARNFPHNTCPASRHVQLMAEALSKGREYPMLQEEPEHCAVSMLATVAALYEARTALAASQIALTAAVEWAAPMADAPVSSRPDWFDMARKALAASPAPKAPSCVDAVLAELARATVKFPTWPTDPLHAVAVVGEEAGELHKAVLQAVYEPHKSTPEDVATEAVQTAAMALRFLMSLDRYRYTRGEQHSQAAAPGREGET